MTAIEILDNILPEGYAITEHDGISAALFLKGYTPFTHGGIDAYYVASHEVYLTERAAVAALTAQGIKADGDTSLLPLKLLAAKSGLASYGYNRLTYTAKLGSRFAIGAVRIFEKLEERGFDAAADMPCASCGKCLKACPTGAIIEGGFCKEKCLREYMNHPTYDETFMKALGGRVLGCDTCQRVCPMNKREFIAPLPELSDAVATIIKGGAGTLEPLIGANYARKKKLISLALIVAGNTNRHDLLTEISAHKEDEKTAPYAERAEKLLVF